jgi:hypothetical protein
MQHSAEFFWHSAKSKTNASAFVTALKAKVLQKWAIGDLAEPMAIK